MVKRFVQYPHTATLPGSAGQATQDENGIIQTSQPGSEFSIKGRYEPSTRTQEIQVTDGTTAKVKGIFYTPVNVPDIKPGLRIKISNQAGEVVLNTKVLYFDRGQLHGRVYL